MEYLVKLRRMSRWHIPVGQVSRDGHGWWQLACGRTIQESDPSAITSSGTGWDLCEVCARSVVDDAEKIVTYPTSADRITSDTVGHSAGANS